MAALIIILIARNSFILLGQPRVFGVVCCLDKRQPSGSSNKRHAKQSEVKMASNKKKGHAKEATCNNGKYIYIRTSNNNELCKTVEEVGISADKQTTLQNKSSNKTDELAECTEKRNIVDIYYDCCCCCECGMCVSAAAAARWVQMRRLPGWLRCTRSK